MIFEGFQRDVSSLSLSHPPSSPFSLSSSFLTSLPSLLLPSGSRPNLSLHQIPLLHPPRNQRNLSQGTQLGTNRRSRTQPRLPRRFQTSLHPPLEQDRKLKHGRKDGSFPRDRSPCSCSCTCDGRREGESQGRRRAGGDEVPCAWDGWEGRR